ncbi:MAG TPA: riboflavin synthase [Bacteroidetes bacterium]|nr:riboflavin synthase [Bacteroidota bacterium]
MFTGIIEGLGEVTAVIRSGDGIKVTYSAPFASELSIDDSVCVNGVCQTVIACDSTGFTTQLVEETLRKTNFGSVHVGQKANLERSMTMQHRLDGHIVQGHVDSTSRIISIEQEDTGWLYTIGLDKEQRDYIVGRGSIAINGISLTVARDLGDSFMVAIIPYTYEFTNLHTLKIGDEVNLEFDILGKYVLKYLKNREN